MTYTASAKSKFYIGPQNSADLTAAAYAALTEWVEVLGIEDLGEAGGEAKDLTVNLISDGFTRHVAGSIDNGTLEITVARDADDDGQNAMKAAFAARKDRAFKIELNDKPDGGTTNTIFYWHGPVLSAKNAFKTGDDITKTTFKVAVSGPIVEVPAA